MINLTSPEGGFSKDFTSYEEMIDTLETQDVLPLHLGSDVRLNQAFYNARHQPHNKKVESVKEALAKSGFIIKENE